MNPRSRLLCFILVGALLVYAAVSGYRTAIQTADITRSRQLAIDSLADFTHIEFLFDQALDRLSPENFQVLAAALDNRRYQIDTVVQLFKDEITPEGWR